MTRRGRRTHWEMASAPSVIRFTRRGAPRRMHLLQSGVSEPLQHVLVTDVAALAGYLADPSASAALESATLRPVPNPAQLARWDKGGGEYAPATLSDDDLALLDEALARPGRPLALDLPRGTAPEAARALRRHPRVAAVTVGGSPATEP